MKKTRFISIFLALLLLSAVSCGESASSAAGDTTAFSGEDTTAEHNYYSGHSLNGAFADGHVESILREAWKNGASYGHKMLNQGYENDFTN